MSTQSETQAVKDNMQNIKDELTQLFAVKEALERLCDLERLVFESKIVIPKVTTNLKMVGAADLNIDMINLKNATKEVALARYNFYKYSRELADVIANIDALKNLYKEYQEHLRQFFNKQATNITDEMIYDKWKKAMALKDKSPEEAATLKGITAELPKRISSDKEMRLELYESLQNIILQHG